MPEGKGRVEFFNNGKLGDLVQIENHPLQLITVEPVVGQPLTARPHGNGRGHQVLLKPNPVWGLRGIP